MQGVPTHQGEESLAGHEFAKEFVEGGLLGVGACREREDQRLPLVLASGGEGSGGVKFSFASELRSDRLEACQGVQASGTYPDVQDP